MVFVIVGAVVNDDDDDVGVVVALVVFSHGKTKSSAASGCLLWWPQLNYHNKSQFVAVQLKKLRYHSGDSSASSSAPSPAKHYSLSVSHYCERDNNMTRVISTFAPTGFILGTLPPTKSAQMSLSGRQLVASLSIRAFFLLVLVRGRFTRCCYWFDSKRVAAH